jgi:hypothetical protein
MNIYECQQNTIEKLSKSSTLMSMDSEECLVLLIACTPIGKIVPWPGKHLHHHHHHADDQGVEDEEEDYDDVDGEESGDEDENAIAGNEAAEMGKSLKRKRQVKVKEQKKKVTRKGRPKAHQARKVRNPKKN